MIGQSQQFRAMLAQLRRFAACDAPVLIEGETGTGKELAAREIHYCSRRSGSPFVPVNCGALADSLIETELFGHRRGAFTDAKSAHEGLVTLAHGGTLFLDEVDTLSSKGQITLLRFLQDNQYRPVGDGELRSANVRVICATNATLESLVEAGQFRRDLLYRLNALRLLLPPLRERPGDVVLLARHFLDVATRRLDKSPKRWTDEALGILAAYRWPGNLRELENVTLRACLCSDNDRIELSQVAEVQPHLLPGDAAIGATLNDGFGAAKVRAIQVFECTYLTNLMQQTGGNVSLAAKLSCTERRQLGKLLKKHGIVREHFKSGQERRNRQTY